MVKLTPKAKEILELAISHNKENNLYDDVMRFAGHSQVSTTLNHSFFSMQGTDKKEELFTKIPDEIAR